MDPYEDLKAFDRLISYLKEDPFMGEEVEIQGRKAQVYRQPGEYPSELHKRSRALASAINYVIDAGYVIEQHYTWDKLYELMEQGGIDPQAYTNQEIYEAKAESLRIFESARQRLTKAFEGKPKPVKKYVPTPSTSKSKPEKRNARTSATDGRSSS